MKKHFFRLMVLTSIVALTLSACRKNEEADNDTTAGEANAEAERVYDDVDRSISEAACMSKYLDNTGGNIINTTCPTITIDHPDSTTWPKTVTIDFGSTNCTGWGNIPRRGKIISVFTGKFRSPGTVITTTFDNYYVNDNHVEGTKTITNLGTNGAGNLYYSVVVSNAKITRTDGSFMTWNSTRTREWTQGSNTIGNTTDDVFLITGSGSGTNFAGNAFAVNITSPLQVQRGCKWIESGVIEITPANKPMRTIDFGNGQCDNQATMTIKNKTFNITLKG
jgi:hypothetical protein